MPTIRSRPLRRGRRRLGAALGLLLVAALPGVTAAFSYTIPLSRVASYASPLGHWKGTLGAPCYAQMGSTCLNNQMSGTFQLQASLFKEVESDPYYDYWVGQASIIWNITGGWNAGFAGDNPAGARIMTSWANQGGVYDAAGTAVAQGNCASISVGAAYGFFSITASPTLCSNVRDSLTYLAGDGAKWSTTSVVYTPKMDHWFATKLKAGSKPSFQFYVTYPYFKATLASPGYVTYTRTSYTNLYFLTAP